MFSKLKKKSWSEGSIEGDKEGHSDEAKGCLLGKSSISDQAQHGK
jgi:hypothetical protein